MTRQEHAAPRTSGTEFLDLVGDGIISTDESGRILLFNRAAEKIFGYETHEVLGQPVEILLPERFRDAHADQVRGFASGIDTAGRLMGHRREVVGLRSNGYEFPIEATLSRRNLNGRSVMTAAIRDVSERKRLEEENEARSRALEQSENRLKLALKGGQMGAWEWDLRSDALLMDSTARRLWGFPTASELDVEAAFDRIHPADLEGVRGAIRQATESGDDYGHEFRIIQPGGKKLWISGRAIVVRDADGRPERMIGVTFDITGRQERSEQRRLLLAEMGHRIKNMMTLVNSVVSMTARSATSVETYRKSLQGRLAAIAAANAALLKTGWQSVGLREQVVSELEAYRDPERGNLSVDGPEISLPPQLALSLRLVFHELATNAAKYGALGSPDGRVDIGWSIEEAAESRHLLVIEWRESGGPPVSPPGRTGFGTTLITRSLAAHGGARVELDHRPEGVFCRMALPWEGPEPTPDRGPLSGSPDFNSSAREISPDRGLAPATEHSCCP